ncbi:ABC transporter ATP-binding protein [Streptomyces sp. NPDC017940]|uniref:ABC transporter ATP-binding protein n=1 Tax=Streptomyces sp. NPDC017940 TaxID=3365017 RepID=UPI00379CB310
MTTTVQAAGAAAGPVTGSAGSTRGTGSTASAGRSPSAVSAVSFQQVSKAYGEVRAVDGLTLDLYPGETVALLGPNGAGKSSTLDLLLGLRRPDSGTVRVFGTSPRDAIAAGRVGAMLQSGGLMDGVTVRELVGLACELHPRPHRVHDVLAAAGLAQIADRKVDKLSGGQEQRVRFAVATAGASDLIVLDEPTTGMDVTARQAFWATVREQADQGRAVLFATHYLEEADAVADRVLVLHRGRLLADGTAAGIKARAGIRKVSFDLLDADARGTAGPVLEQRLRKLPFLSALTVSHAGSAAGPGLTVRLQSTDADATVHALYGLGLHPRNLEVAGLGLEQAFVAITAAEEARTA